MFFLQSSSVTYPSLLKSRSLKSYWLSCSVMSDEIFWQAVQTSSCPKTSLSDSDKRQKSLNDWDNKLKYFLSAKAIFVNPLFDYFQSVIILPIKVFYFTSRKSSCWHAHHLRTRSLERSANERSVKIRHRFLQTRRLFHRNSKLTLKVTSSFFINIKKIVCFVLKLKWHLWKIREFFKVVTCEVHDSSLFSFINTLT